MSTNSPKMKCYSCDTILSVGIGVVYAQCGKCVMEGRSRPPHQIECHAEAQDEQLELEEVAQ